MINTHPLIPSHIYLQQSYENQYEYSDYMNKLFCTFSSKEDLDTTLAIIQGQYNILFNKIFILYIQSTEEYVFTLYTINALNDLIKSLNGGVLDNKFPIDWKEYQNCILLTHAGDLKKLDTKIYKIITL
jgi:hypothetical protein